MSEAVMIEPVNNGFKATVGRHSMVFPEYKIAAAWGDAVRYGYQPDTCIFGGGSCGYPIDDCQNCPCYPGNHDPYWGMTKAVFLSG